MIDTSIIKELLTSYIFIQFFFLTKKDDCSREKSSKHPKNLNLPYITLQKNVQKSLNQYFYKLNVSLLNIIHEFLEFFTKVEAAIRSVLT